ncbi:MAG: hypothetical protein HY246_03695 [Proteobacteria bacterium]|nr:hypothetical protein [Pseudomonadota bacterium]
MSRAIFSRGVLAIIAAAVIVGTAALAADNLKVENIPPQQALNVLKELRSGSGKLDIANLLVARLAVDGNVIDVTTLNPAVLVSVGQGEHEAGTVFAFTADRKTLVFFTRDLVGGDGHRLNLPVSEFDKQPKFAFPTLTPGGAPREAKIEIRALLRQP